MKRALLRISIAAALAAPLGACAGIMAHKGAVIDPELASAVQPGVDNKASVAKLLGNPTFDGQFNDNDWYYVSRDTKQVAFRNPRVRKETVLHVRFDQAGNVASVSRSGRELVASIDPTKRETPTLGRKKSFFEELFGNISTVNGPGLPGSGGY